MDVPKSKSIRWKWSLQSTKVSYTQSLSLNDSNHDLGILKGFGKEKALVLFLWEGKILTKAVETLTQTPKKIFIGFPY